MFVLLGCYFTQRSYRRFGRIYRSQRDPGTHRSFQNVHNYKSKLCNTPKEQRSHFRRTVSLTPHTSGTACQCECILYISTHRMCSRAHSPRPPHTRNGAPQNGPEISILNSQLFDKGGRTNRSRPFAALRQRVGRNQQNRLRNTRERRATSTLGQWSLKCALPFTEHGTTFTGWGSRNHLGDWSFLVAVLVR